jgi:hypothetical protein
MAVFKNGIFAIIDGQIINPTTNLTISIPCGAFFQAAGVLNLTQRSAIYQLVSDLQSYSIWDKMKAIYPMVGQAGVSSSFEVNLKDPSTFRGTFFGGWTFASTGIQGNGTNAYMDTGFNSSIEVALNSHAYGIYLPNNYSSGTLFQELGAYGPGDYGTILYGNFGGSSYNRIHSNEWNGIYQAGNGFILATRTDANVTRNFLNGVFKIASSEASTLASPYNYYIGARGNNGSGIFFSPKLISFAMMSDGLTDTEAANLYTAVQRFQTTLGRQV